jgi:chemotaxis protein methyltransferase CheR
MNPKTPQIVTTLTDDKHDEHSPFIFIRNRMGEFYEKPENSEKFYTKIKEFIINKENLDLSQYRDNYIQRRIYYRILRLECKSFKDYYEFLLADPKESARFIESFTIHVTQFFRDETPFRYLERELLPRIAEQKQHGSDKTIRILSAPCSTGEEPYSFAIIADYMKTHSNLTNPIDIQACDVDPKVIEYAQQGIYPSDTMKTISPASIQRNFKQIGADLYEIKPHLKNYVTFFTHDLLKPLNLHNFDIIACRNFLIYISKQNQQQVIKNLVKSLNPDGYLMLGKTEGFPLLNIGMFQPDNLKEHIYQLKNTKPVVSGENQP